MLLGQTGSWTPCQTTTQLQCILKYIYQQHYPHHSHILQTHHPQPRVTPLFPHHHAQIKSHTSLWITIGTVLVNHNNKNTVTSIPSPTSLTSLTHRTTYPLHTNNASQLHSSFTSRTLTHSHIPLQISTHWSHTTNQSQFYSSLAYKSITRTHLVFCGSFAPILALVQSVDTA